MSSVFWSCALAGSLFFALTLGLNFIAGMHFHLGLHLPIFHHDVSHHGLDGSDTSFRLLSIQSLTGFIMMFGWIGLASFEEWGYGEGGSLVLGAAAGFATMYLTALLFSFAERLSSAGSVFNLADAVGKRGVVYERISAGGRGQIQLELGDVTHEIEAVSDERKELASHSSVEVVRVIDDKTVSVRAV